MNRVLANPDACSGRSYANSKGNTECVEFIKQTLAAPGTSAWREGTKLKKLAAGERDPLTEGQPSQLSSVADTPQMGNTGMHAAIYLGQNADGIQVLDQWRRQGKVLPRTIPWKVRRPGLSNDGNAFSAIEW